MPGQLNATFGLNNEQADAAILKTDANIKKLTTSLQQLDAGYGESAAAGQALGASTDQLAGKTEKQISWIRQARMEHRQTAYAMREGSEVMMLSMFAMMALMNTDENASKASKELNKTLMETVMAFQAMRFVMYSLQDNAGFAGLAAKMGMSTGGLGMAISAVIALSFGLISFLKNQTSTTKELNDELAKQYELEVKLGMIKLPQQIVDAQKKVTDAQKDYNDAIQKQISLKKLLADAERDQSGESGFFIITLQKGVNDANIGISKYKTALETAQVALKGLTDEQKKSDTETLKEQSQIVEGYKNVKDAAYQSRVAAGLVGEGAQMSKLLADQKQLTSERNALTYQSAIWYEWDKKVSDNLKDIDALQKQIADEKQKTADGSEKELLKQAEIASQQAKLSDYSGEQVDWSIATLHNLEGQTNVLETQLKIEEMIQTLENEKSKKSQQRKTDAATALKEQQDLIRATVQYKLALSATAGAFDGLFNYLNIGMRDAKNVWDSIWLGMERSAINAIQQIVQEWMQSQIMKTLFPSIGATATTAAAGESFLESALPFMLAPLGLASGGYTGGGSRYEPAGIVHRGEVVFEKPIVDKVGVNRMLAMRASLQSAPSSSYGGNYSGGGFVGGGNNNAIVSEIRALNNKLSNATLKADRSGLWIAWDAENKNRTRLQY